jgi:predicted amidophosphoribosyltransferase
MSEQKRVCSHCGGTDKRVERGSAICSKCYKWTHITYCPSCESHKTGKKMRLCSNCIEEWKTRVVDGQFLPLEEGENPRCVYPDCTHCPLPDCLMADDAVLRRYGIKIIDDTKSLCPSCHKKFEGYETFCPACARQRGHDNYMTIYCLNLARRR